MQDTDYLIHFNKLMSLLDELPNAISYSETIKIQEIMRKCFKDGQSRSSADWQKFEKWKALNKEFQVNNRIT